MTPEGKVKRDVKRILNERGAYYFMPVQNGFGASGHDFHCIYRGVGFTIETKAGNAKMTKRQEAVAREIKRAGGATLLINEKSHPCSQLQEFLDKVDRIVGVIK